MPGRGGGVGRNVGGVVCRGGIHPSRGVCGSANLRGASRTPPPTVCPGTGGSGRSRRGEGTPPYGWGYGNACGVTRAPVSGPPRGRGRACPARRVAWAEVCGWFVGRGLDPSAGCLRRREPPRIATRGRAATRTPAGRRGRRPLRVARERTATEACPSSGPAGPPSPEGEGKGCGWRRRKPSAGCPGIGNDSRPGEPFRPSLRLATSPDGEASLAGSARAKGAPSGVTPRCAGRCRGATEGSGPEGLAEPARPEGFRQPVPPPPLTPAADPRCGAEGSGCSTSGPTKPALYRCNPGRCRGGSRR